MLLKQPIKLSLCIFFASTLFRLIVLAACVPKAKRIAFYGKTRVKVLLKKSVIEVVATSSVE